MNNELSITTLFQLHYDSIPSDTRHHQHHVHQQQPMIIFGNYCYYVYNNNLCYINIRYKICKHVVMMNDISCITCYNKEQLLFIVLTTDGMMLMIKVCSNNIEYIIELTNLPTLYNNYSYDKDDFDNVPNNNQNYNNNKTNNINISNPYQPPPTTTTNQASLLYDADRRLLVVQFNHALILYNIYEKSEDIVLKLIISSSTVDDMTPFKDITSVKDITRVNNDITFIKNIEKYQIWGNNDVIYIIISNSSNYLSLLALQRQLINNNYEWITTYTCPVETNIPVKSIYSDRHSNDKDNDVHCYDDVGNVEMQPNDGDDNNDHTSDHHHHLYENYSRTMFEEVYTRHKSWITAISRRSYHHQHHHSSTSSSSSSSSSTSHDDSNYNKASRNDDDYDNDGSNYHHHHHHINRKYNNVRNNYRRCIEATGDSQGMIIFWECYFIDHHHHHDQQQHRQEQQQQQHDVHSNNHDHENDDSNYNKNNNHTISPDVNNNNKQSKLKYIMKNKDIFRNNSITDIVHDRMHHHNDHDNNSNDDDNDDASSVWWIGDTSNVITSIHVLIRRKEIVVLKRLVLFGGCYSSLSNNNNSSSSYNNSNNENAADGTNDYVDSNDSARSIGFPTQIEWISSMTQDNPSDDFNDDHNHDNDGDDNDQDDDDDDDDDDKNENKKSSHHLRRKNKSVTIKHNKNHSIGILRAYCVTSGMMVECLLNENIESISKLWLGINDIPAVDPLVRNPGNRAITSAAVNVFNNVVIDLCTILPKLNLIITTAINSKYLYITNVITGFTIDMIYMDENHCKCISSYDDNNNDFRRYDHNNDDGHDNIGSSGNYGENDVSHDSEDDTINNRSGSNLNNNNNNNNSSRKNRKKLIYDCYVGIGYAN